MTGEIEIKFKRINDLAPSQSKTPVYATHGSAGADLCACIQEDIVIKPGERAKVPTGIALEIPMPGIVGLVFARSGLADKKGLALSNGVGVIDSDYRGEIKVLVTNLGQEEITIKNEERIAQIVFVPVLKAVFTETMELDDTLRGEGGFGSTGIR